MAVAKRIPLRTCIGCREQKEKFELIRIVRTEEGEALVDLSGRRNGRGAYICPNTRCLARAFKTKALERALQVPISQEVMDGLTREIERIDES